ncbi:MAG: PQQ-binding-like beta-propeller repeat protein [Alphaproteobacteria bacterium]|nr:PQQ-binding-like beta-propeller repeat protein [Alphaproteobacteria bacterium]
MRQVQLAAAFGVAAILLGGCSVVDQVSDLFDTTTRKSELKGERIPVMSLDQSLQPDPTLGDTEVVLPAPYRNDDWAQPGGYPSNALYHLEASGPLRQVWSQEAGKGSDSSSRLTAPPIVADGKVFVLDAQATVYAFDAKNGQPRWHRELAPQGESSTLHALSLGMFGKDSSIDPTKGFGGGLAFDDGKIYATTGFGDVIAMEARGGKRVWTKNLGVPIVNAPVASGGRVFVSSQDNHFYALAQTDGRKLWDHQGIAESAGILESTSAAVAGDSVIAPYTSGELFALRIQNGRPAWNDMLTSSGNVTALSELDDIAGRPVVDRGLVYAISHSGVMVAINLATGDRSWSRDVGGIQTPWAAGDYVYVLSTDQQVLCLTRKDGRVKWMHQMARFEDMEKKEDPIVWAGPVLVSDRLIVVSSQGYAVSLSPYTGKVMGRVEIPAAAYIAPVVANDTLYLWTNDAQLVALR